MYKITKNKRNEVSKASIEPIVKAERSPLSSITMRRHFSICQDSTGYYVSFITIEDNGKVVTDRTISDTKAITIEKFKIAVSKELL